MSSHRRYAAPGGSYPPVMDETTTTAPTIGHVAHFAINADDVEATRRFYEQTVGWQFHAWGPPGFFHIRLPEGSWPGPIGALQARRDLDGGVRTAGFECTVAVEDVGACIERAIAAGGRVLLEPTVITGVGELAFLADPSGNPVGVMRYDADAE